MFGMSIVDLSAVKLTGEAKQNNLPPECGQSIDAGTYVDVTVSFQYHPDKNN
jgi:hypothetical protein